MNKLDEKYYLHQKGWVKKYLEDIFSEIRITGKENIEELLKTDENIILVPSHRSELDQILVGYVMATEFGRIMKFIGGANLLVPGITAPYNDHALILDLERAGMIPIDRKRFGEEKSYVVEFKNLIRSSSLDKYPVFLTIQDGRSKNGKIEEPQIGLLKIVSNSLDSEKTSIVPITIDYDRVLEDLAFKKNTLIKEKIAPELVSQFNRLLNYLNYEPIKKEEIAAAKVAGTMNALLDIFYLIGARYKQTRQSAYFTIGRPIKTKRVTKEIGEQIKAELINNMTITAPMIYSYALKHKMEVNCILDETNQINHGNHCENKAAIELYFKQLFSHRRKSIIEYYANYAGCRIDLLRTR